MVTLEDIKKYLDDELGIDILKRSNKRVYVYGRVIFSKLALEFIKRNKKRSITLNNIAKFIGIGTHASILRYVNVNFKHIENFEPEYYKIYKDYKTIILFKRLTSHLDSEIDYDILMKEYLKLEEELRTSPKIREIQFENDYLNDVVSVAKRVDKVNRELFLTRIKPIAKMINSTIINN